MRMLSAALFCSCGALAFGQAQKDVPDATNTLFFEGLGQAIFWSANFEHTEYASERFGFHMRVGFGLWSTKNQSPFFALPLTFSLSYGGTHRAEAGAGLLFYNYGNGTNAPRSSGLLLPTYHAGYRFQKVDGGLFLRGGMMVAEVGDAPGFDASSGAWGLNPYVCIGGTF